MSDDTNPFADFDFDNLKVGEQPAPLNAPPVQETAATPVERPKRGRKAKPAAAKAEKVKRTRGPRRQPTLVTDTQIAEAAAAPPAKKTRKPRVAKTEPRAIKLDLAMAMHVASTLKDGDGPLFQKMVHVLSGLNKASRDRIRAALGKVFA